MSLVKSGDKPSDIIAGDEDDETIQLIRNKSISVAREASKLPPQAAYDPDEAKAPDENFSHPLEEEKQSGEATTANDRTRRTDAVRPSRVSQQEPFIKGLKPKKSVLKHGVHPIARTSSTYDSTTPQSPTPSSPASVASTTGNSNERGVAAATTRAARAPIQEDGRKCCVVM